MGRGKESVSKPFVHYTNQTSPETGISRVEDRFVGPDSLRIRLGSDSTTPLLVSLFLCDRRGIPRVSLTLNSHIHCPSPYLFCTSGTETVRKHTTTLPSSTSPSIPPLPSSFDSVLLNWSLPKTVSVTKLFETSYRVLFFFL